MLINPINAAISNTNFKSIIKPTDSLREGFDLINKDVKSGSMKNLNYVKDFMDSLVKIRDSEKSSAFKIDIDKNRADYTYTKINGRRVSGGHNERQINLQDGYLVVEGIKRYASKLENIQPSCLDILKLQIEETEAKLDELIERYSLRLKAEVEQAQKMIFKDVK